MSGLLDTNAAAEYLGISRRSVERLIEYEEIEVVRLPGIRKNLFRTEDLDKLIKESRTGPATVSASRHSVASWGGNGRNS